MESDTTAHEYSSITLAGNTIVREKRAQQTQRKGGETSILGRKLKKNHIANIQLKHQIKVINYTQTQGNKISKTQFKQTPSAHHMTQQHTHRPTHEHRKRFLCGKVVGHTKKFTRKRGGPRKGGVFRCGKTVWRESP